MYDIVFITDNPTTDESYDKLKKRFSLVKHATSLDDARKKVCTTMFWIVYPDINILETFNFDYIVEKWDEAYIHVFKNGDFYDGVALLSKNASISTNECNSRFYIDKKEVDIQASIPRNYDIFHISTYEEYKAALANSKTDMFWMTTYNITISDTFNFDLYFSHDNLYDRNQNHAFIHRVADIDFYDGVFLCSKNAPLGKHEVEYRFPVDRKEWDIVASGPALYDIVFVSYFEKFADSNFELLKSAATNQNLHRVDGIKGIHQAHIEAAKLVSTDMFWVIDADAHLVDTFQFDYQVTKFDQDIVHVWRSSNPINGLTYGYGGVKLLPTKLTLNVDVDSVDMTTSISSKFKAVDEISNITVFNTDPFSTWKSAFRECAKLSSRAVVGQLDDETTARLDIWCTVGQDAEYGEYAILGAIAGRKYGYENAGNKPALLKINDFDWLLDQFNLC